MPHPLRSVGGHFFDIAKGAWPQRWTQPVPSRARWSSARAQDYSAKHGWLVGCNFIPSTAGNQLEMWQRETFDPRTIERELGWAAGLGFNCVRVFLHDLLWTTDSEGFLDRLDQVLGIADNQGVSLMPVLFDGVWNPRPRSGPQRDPRPRVHNSMWVQGPGARILGDPSQWSSLRPYVEGVMNRFGGDSRVVVWDLFNEPDQRNAISYPRAEIRNKTRYADGLLNKVFDWAEGVDPDQPLTAGVFMGVSGAPERVSRINRTMLARSDVISFHSYLGAQRLETTISHLTRYDRPLLCTEWLARPIGSTVELLGLMKRRRVSAFNWGLVDGRSQTRYPWSSWFRPTPDDAIWFHDLLHADGMPYRTEETALIARIIRGDNDQSS